MFLRLTIFSAILSLVSMLHAIGAEGHRAAEVYDWPPAFEALFGNPVIKKRRGLIFKQSAMVYGAGRYNAYDGMLRGTQPSGVVVSSAAKLSAERLNELAAEALARRFYQLVLHSDRRTRYEDLMQMGELLPMEKERFIAIATKRLAGELTGLPEEDAWWNVRMGSPEMAGSRYQLVIINLHYDEGGGKVKLNHGHFCFGLREIGGDAEQDLVFDFRAPWDLDRRPKITEAVNLHNKLRLMSDTQNLYDWLYTQTEYRNCWVNLWFLPATQSQVTLLRSFNERGVQHAAGSFRPFRKNCASLGSLFFARLQPFTADSLLRRGPSIDFPVGVANRVKEPYEKLPFFRVENMTHVNGREPTAKSEIHRAQPSRASSRVFRDLQKVPGAN